MTKYYILTATNAQGAIELLFGDYDHDTVKDERLDQIEQPEYSKFMLSALASDKQATIDAKLASLRGVSTPEPQPKRTNDTTHLIYETKGNRYDFIIITHCNNAFISMVTTPLDPSKATPARETKSCDTMAEARQVITDAMAFVNAKRVHEGV